MKKVVSVSLLLALAVFAFGQIEAPGHKLKFGFNAGLNYSNLQVETASLLKPGDIQTSNGVGLRMGIIMDYELTKHFSLSPKAEMSFNSGRILIAKAGDEKQVYTVMPTTIELASHFNYKLKAGKLSPYILFGPNFKIPLSDNKNTMHQISRTSDIAFDLGIGLEKMFSDFSFAPELRYSYGLINLSKVETISKLNFHSISLVINFKE